jgi:hypothetical protein
MTTTEEERRRKKCHLRKKKMEMSVMGEDDKLSVLLNITK